MTLNYKAFTTGALLGLVLAGTAAFAGWKSDDPVYVGSDYFAGSITSTRNSSDSVQQIYCQGWTFGTGTGTNPNTYCFAKSSGGTQLGCTTNSQYNLMAANLTFNSDSYVYVGLPYAGSAACGSISMGTYSYTPPKKA